MMMMIGIGGGLVAAKLSPKVLLFDASLCVVAAASLCSSIKMPQGLDYRHLLGQR